MTWFRLDDGFAVHAKVITAGNAAVGLWVRAACWSAAQLTDGVIPAAVARTLGTTKEAAALEAAGLWRRDGDTWVIPDWLHYQPSAAQVREQQRVKSEAKQRAGRIGGLRSGEARAKQTPSTDEANGKRNEAPSRPVPSLSINSRHHSSNDDPDHDADDDRYRTIRTQLVDHKRTTSRTPIDNPAAWAATVEADIDRTHGPAIRQAIANGSPDPLTELGLIATPPTNPLAGAWNR